MINGLMYCPSQKHGKYPRLNNVKSSEECQKWQKLIHKVNTEGLYWLSSWGFFCFVFFCNGELKIFFFQIIQKEEYCMIHNFEMNLNCLKTGIVNSLSYNLSDMKRNTEKNLHTEELKNDHFRKFHFICILSCTKMNHMIMKFLRIIKQKSSSNTVQLVNIFPSSKKFNVPRL